MARALLVDDEKYIRNGLRAIISRSNSIFTDIDESVNGADALQKLSQNRYDLVITDLIMPHTDGIELVARIDRMDYKPYTVVLSGHDEFKYAQEAINYGVKAYLLKPVNRNELIGIVKKAEAEIIKRKSAEEKVLDNGQTEFYANQLKLILLSENTVNEESDKTLYDCGLNTANESYRIVVMNSCGVYGRRDKREGGNTALAASLCKYFEKFDSPGYCFLDNNDNSVAILNEKIDISEVIKFTERVHGYECTAGIGERFYNAPQMRLSYNQADYALRYRLLKPDAAIISYENIPSPDNKFVIPMRLIKNLAGMLDTERKTEMINMVCQIFDEDTIEKYHLEYLEKLSYVLKNETVQYLSECIPHKIDFIQEQESSFKSIYEFNDIHEYIQYINKFITNINDELLEFKRVCNTDNTIEMAVKYVQENYSNDLTMAEVANRTCLSYSYFSVMFKERTGLNFVDYLKMIRVEKAKELLKNSVYKIYEIAEMVGYSNAKHFTTIFRALTGMSPKEYRERLYIN